MSKNSENSEFKIYEVVSDLPEAEILVSALCEHGVNAHYTKDDCGSMEPHMQWSRGIKIYVPVEQWEQAQELKDMNIDPKELEELALNHEEPSEMGLKRSSVYFYMTLFFVLLLGLVLGINFIMKD